MPSYKTLMPSRFLKKEDVPKPVLVTIDRIEMVNAAPQNRDPEVKAAAYFRETDRPMTLNRTNLEILAEIAGEDYALWSGVRLVLYSDPNVAYGGKRVGGLRLRAPKVKSAGAPIIPAAPPVDLRYEEDETGSEFPDDFTDEEVAF